MLFSTLNRAIDDMIAKMSWGVDTQSRYGMHLVNRDFILAVRNKMESELPRTRELATKFAAELSTASS